jgi:hypothetical protein
MAHHGAARSSRTGQVSSARGFAAATLQQPHHLQDERSRTTVSPRHSLVLLYGVLPATATGVERFYEDGRATTAPIATDPATRIWAVPITPGDNPVALEYRDQQNQTFERAPL